MIKSISSFNLRELCDPSQKKSSQQRPAAFLYSAAKMQPCGGLNNLFFLSSLSFLIRKLFLMVITAKEDNILVAVAQQLNSLF